MTGLHKRKSYISDGESTQPIYPLESEAARANAIPPHPKCLQLWACHCMTTCTCFDMSLFIL